MTYQHCLLAVSTLTTLCVPAQLLPQNSSGTETRILNLARESERILSSSRMSSSSLSVTVNSRTSLYVQSGQTVTLYFDVTNNNDWSTFTAFYCDTTTSTVLSIEPKERWITTGVTVSVKVTLQLTNNAATAKETVTFTAVTYSTGGEVPTSIKANLYTGQQVSDSSSPDLSYTISGNCVGASSPSTCSSGVWSLQVTACDSKSGLLSVESVPSGFEWTSDFTAGTTDTVSGRYSASCCFDKVDLIATDLNGNQNRLTVNIDDIWLSTGAIVSIVLGCILLLLLIIIICCGVGFCIQRKRKSNTFTMHT